MKRVSGCSVLKRVSDCSVLERVSDCSVLERESDCSVLQRVSFSDDNHQARVFGAYASNKSVGSSCSTSKAALQSLYNAYTAQRATGNFHLRYPMTFCHDALLRVRLTHTVVYVSFIESKAAFKFKALLDPVNLVKKYDIVEVSSAGVSDDDCMYEALQRLDLFIKCADCKA
jgi:hypothetical protein